MKKYWPYIITLAIIILGVWIIFTPKKVSGVPKEAILFVGEGCPHCKKVEEFITANEVRKKIQFTTKEVWYNQDNALIMAKVWKQCGLNDQGGMGVPLYWDGTSCFNGDQEIINLFQSKLNK
jgi:glutaredoxin